MMIFMHKYTRTCIVLSVCLYFCLLSCGKKPDGLEDSIRISALPLDQAATDSLLQKNPFSVQVAALTDIGNTEELVARLKSAGMEVFVVTHSNILRKIIYRVLLGPFRLKSEAQSALEHVKSFGYNEAFLKRHTNDTAKESKLSLSGDADSASEEGVKKLSEDGNCAYPQWSPSSREIAFYRKSRKQSGIYAVGTGGGAVSRIAESLKEMQVIGKFRWSPDGERMAFVAREFNDKFEWVENLFVVNRNGLKPKKVYFQDGLPFKIASIKWSPSGSHLAIEADFGRSDDFLQRVQRVIIVPLASDEKPFALGNPGATSSSVGWRIDAKFIYIDAFPAQSAYTDSPDKFGWEVVQYDLIGDRTAVLRSALMTEDVVQAEYLVNQNVLVFFANVKMASKKQHLVLVDLQAGGQNVLFEQNFSKVSRAGFIVTTDEHILFVENDKLWVNTVAGRKAIIQLPTVIEQWTVSPSGKRICYTKNGKLFTMRLEDFAH